MHRSLLLSPRYMQIMGCSSYHATDIRGHTDHLEALAYSLSRSRSIAAKDTQRHLVLARGHFNAVQGQHKFGFSTFSARRQAKLSMQIVRADKRHVDAWRRENLIDVLQPLKTLDLNDHHDLLVRSVSIAVPVSDAKAIGAKIGRAHV